MEFRLKTISITDDIVPIADFKASIAQWFKKIRNTGHPLIITQNGKPAGVLLTPQDYDELVYQKAYLESVARGIEDADNGRTYSTEKVKAVLSSRRSRE